MDDISIPEVINPVDPIDLSIFIEHTEETFLSMISSISKLEKQLIIDNSILPNINFFTNMDKLEKIFVNKKINILNDSPLVSNCQIIIYIIQPKKNCLELIENQIKNYMLKIKEKKEQNLQKSNKNDTPKINISSLNDNLNDYKEFHLIFIPKINNECDNYISKSYYFEVNTYIHNLGIDIYPFDYDLMSLELNDCIKDLYIDKNYNCLGTLCKSILKFETVFGKIDNKYYKGDNAFKLHNLVKKEEENYFFENDTNFICSIFFDRNIDFITPLCTVNTYEGLLNEYFGINFNSMKIETKLLLKKDKKEFTKIDLSNRNKLYSMIKDYNIIRLKLFLHRRIRYYNNLIKESKEETESSKLLDNLKKIQQISKDKNALEDNILISNILSEKMNQPIYNLYLRNEQFILSLIPSEKLNDFYENEMAKKNYEPYNLLKLFCLESLTQNGIKKNYENFKKEFLTINGFENIILWNNLEKLKILKKSEKSNFNFEKLTKYLKLIVENINLLEEDDASYVYSGYCPITIRLLEKGIKFGFSKLKNLIDMLPGESYFGKSDQEILNIKEKKFILLVYIGGITYGEIAAIRYLNENMEFYKFIILTTGIISTKKFFQSLSLQNEDFS
jgi:hypothetical protein